MSTEDWPDHHQELGRKTMAVLDTWTKRYNANQITRREFYILVQGLYDATSGLMPMELSDLLSEIHAELRRESQKPAETQKAA